MGGQVSGCRRVPGDFDVGVGGRKGGGLDDEVTEVESEGSVL